MEAVIKVQIGRSRLFFALSMHFIILGFTIFYVFAYSRAPADMQSTTLLRLFVAYIFLFWTTILPNILNIINIKQNYGLTLPECVWVHRQTMNSKYFIPLKFANLIASSVGLAILFVLNNYETYNKIDQGTSIWVALWIAAFGGGFGLCIEAACCWGVNRNILSCCCNKSARHCVLCMKQIKYARKTLSCFCTAHVDCYREWKGYYNVCPYCRVKISLDNPIII